MYVAKHYSGWQATVLQYLQSKYDPKEQKLSADAIGPGLIEAVKAEGTSDIPVKSLQGLCIPFARKKAEEATLSGVEVRACSCIATWPSRALLKSQQCTDKGKKQLGFGSATGSGMGKYDVLPYRVSLQGCI